ncbi:MAG: CPBP family intramembrane glutamic endopeptidase [Bacteroidota bacterium]
MKDIYERIAELCKSQASFALLFALILYFLSLSLILPVILGLTVGIWGGDLLELQSLIAGNLEAFAGGEYLFRLVQAENQMFTWGLVALVMAALLGRPKEVLKLDNNPGPLELMIPALILILIIPLIQLTYIPADSFQLPDFMKDMEESMRLREEQSQKVLMKLFSDPSIGTLLLNILVFAVVPAFFEEFLFRGIIQQQIARNLSPHWAILISAAIFSFIHFQFYGFFGRMILGMVLGYFLYYSGSLWPSILAHFAYNAFSIFLTWLAAAKGMMDTDITQDSYQFPLSLVLFSILSVGILMFLYLRRQRIAQ